MRLYKKTAIAMAVAQAVASFGLDAYFNKINLAMNMADASDSAGHAVTVGSAVTFSSAHPFAGNKTAYFDGSANSYMDVTRDLAFDLGSSDFTIETKVYFDQDVASGYPINCWQQAGGTQRAFQLGANGGWLQAWVQTDAGQYGSSGIAVPARQFVDLALERNGSTLQAYVNGAVAYTTSISGSMCASTLPVQLGYMLSSDGVSKVYKFVGYMGPTRISRFARYKGAYTPTTTAFPSAPLSIVPKLTDYTQGNYVASASSEWNNADYWKAYNPFNFDWKGAQPTGHSGWMPNAVPSVAAPQYLQILFPEQKVGCVWMCNANPNYGSDWTSALNNIGCVKDFTIQALISGTWTTVKTVVGYDPTTLAFDKNVFKDFSFTPVTCTGIKIVVTAVRNAGTPTGWCAGAISSLGITAEGPAAYVDPYASNVSFLLQASSNNTDVLNAKTGEVLTINNGAAIDTVNVKFTKSVKFSGASSVSKASSAICPFGTGDFTIEGWLYPDGTQASNAVVFNTTGQVISLQYYSTLGFGFTTPSGWCAYSSSIKPVINTWSHFAIVRIGQVVTMYLNGVAIGSANNIGGAATNFSSITGISIGNTFKGNIEGLRITPGVARYNGNFSVPTAAF